MINWVQEPGCAEPGLAQLCANLASSTLTNLCTALPVGCAETCSLSPLHCGGGNSETKSQSIGDPR